MKKKRLKQFMAFATIVATIFSGNTFAIAMSEVPNKTEAIVEEADTRAICDGYTAERERRKLAEANEFVKLEPLVDAEEFDLEQQELNQFKEKIEQKYQEFLQKKERQEQKVEKKLLKETSSVKFDCEGVLPPSKEQLSSIENKDVERIVKISEDSPEQSAKIINSYEGDLYTVAVKEVLAGYYADEQNVKQGKIEAFSNAIDKRADSILKGYQEALEERQNASNLDYAPGWVIVQFEEGMTFEEIKTITDYFSDNVRILDGTGKTLEKRISDNESTDGVMITAGIDIGISQTVEDVVKMLRKINGVRVAVANYYLETEGVSEVNDPYVTYQYYLNLINVSDAWTAFTSSNNEYTKAIVAVMDTGVDVNHEDLKNVISQDSVTFYEHNEDDSPMSLFKCKTPYFDVHGTAVAAVIAAESNNNIATSGITSIYDPKRQKVTNMCDILALNVASGAFHPDLMLELEAFNYILSTDQKVDVINMSFGIPTFEAYMLLDSFIQMAHEKGIVLVASAGNNNSDAAHYPSGFEHVISVAALDNSGNKRWYNSNYGNTIDISAIGGLLCAPEAGTKTGVTMSEGKTSIAAAQVSAAAALLLSINPNLEPDMVEFILEMSADDLGDVGWDAETGYGRLNIGHAVQWAKIMEFCDLGDQDLDVKAPSYKETVELDFKVSPYAEYFEVQRADSPTGTYKTISEQLKASDAVDGRIQFQDLSAVPGKTYYYKITENITGFYNGNVSTFSKNKSTYYKVTCSLPPLTITLLNGTIRFNYDAPYDYFMLMRSTNRYDGYNVIAAINAKQGSMYTDDTREEGVTYYYKAYAVYADENGPMLYSPESNIIKYTQN